jgi:23S rRNA (cytosine1962-C5)-methyltransferase
VGLQQRSRCQRDPTARLPGRQQAILEAANGKPLGIVAMSPNNLICARLLSRDIKLPLDKSLLVHRLNVALSLRERLFDKPFYRLVYGDSDLLPGLVVDRFGDILVVQMASATMEAHKDDVIAALTQVLKPSGILFKNDSAARDAEGLNRYVETVYGEVPDWVPWKRTASSSKPRCMKARKPAGSTTTA